VEAINNINNGCLSVEAVIDNGCLSVEAVIDNGCLSEKPLKMAV
jgi:hypothetical protein